MCVSLTLKQLRVIQAVASGLSDAELFHFSPCNSCIALEWTVVGVSI
jgi:hypothetical protein